MVKNERNKMLQIMMPINVTRSYTVSECDKMAHSCQGEQI